MKTMSFIWMGGWEMNSGQDRWNLVLVIRNIYIERLTINYI